MTKMLSSLTFVCGSIPFHQGHTWTSLARRGLIVVSMHTVEFTTVPWHNSRKGMQREEGRGYRSHFIC
jgi:hypothetical protein